MTIFGTTLTRKQTAIGVGIVALVVVLLGVLVPLAFAGDDPEGGEGAPQPPAATGNAAPPAPATTSDNKTPEPTQGETGEPSPAAPSTGPAVPAGWRPYEGDGFTVFLPPGFSASKRGTEVYFQDNTAHRLLIIDQTDQPKPDPVKDWQDQERERAGSTYRNYDKIRLVAVDGYFQKAADWEFTYTTSSGNPQHAQKRGIVVNSKKAFGISWYTSPKNWEPNKKVLEQIYANFKPA